MRSGSRLRWSVSAIWCSLWARASSWLSCSWASDRSWISCSSRAFAADNSAVRMLHAFLELGGSGPELVGGPHPLADEGREEERGEGDPGVEGLKREHLLEERPARRTVRARAPLPRSRPVMR